MDHLLQAKHEFLARWWLPELPEHTVRGTVRYNPPHAIELELDGLLESALPPWPDSPPFTPDIILGSADDGTDLTLIRCLQTQTTFGMGPPTSRVVATHLLIGDHFSALDDLQFERSVCRLGNLEEWLCDQVFSVKRKSPFSITYQSPKPRDIPLGTITANLRVESSFNHNWRSFEQHLVHSAAFAVLPTGRAEPLVWHLEQLNALRTLITLLTGESSWFRHITLRQSAGQSVNTNVEILGLLFTTPGHDVDARHMLLSLPGLPCSLDDFVDRWFKHRGKHDSAHGLYFGAISERMPYAEFDFLAIAQALETYHARCVGTKKQHYLHDRLTALFQRFSASTLSRLFPDHVAFVARVKDTRNYFTHYNPKLTAKAYHGLDLAHAAQMLQVVLAMFFLLDLGIPEKEVVAGVLRHPHSEHELRRWLP